MLRSDIMTPKNQYDFKSRHHPRAFYVENMKKMTLLIAREIPLHIGDKSPFIYSRSSFLSYKPKSLRLLDSALMIVLDDSKGLNPTSVAIELVNCANWLEFICD